MTRLSYIRIATYLVLVVDFVLPKRHFIPVALAIPDEAQMEPPGEWSWRSPAKDITREPREEDITQFVVERSNIPPTKKMSRDEFLDFFRKGKFVGIDGWRKEGARDEPARSEPVLCQGAFAMKSGEVFLWRLVREKVLEIEDAEHRTGWIIHSISQTQ